MYVNLVPGGPHTPGKHNQLIEVQYNDVDVQRANVANLLNEVVQYKTAYVELTLLTQFCRFFYIVYIMYEYIGSLVP